MIKSELVQQIVDSNSDIYKRDVEKIVDSTFVCITEALARGERVELRSFGSFSVSRREERMGRNPRTGEQVKIQARYVPSFKMGKEMKERLNKKA